MSNMRLLVILVTIFIALASLLAIGANIGPVARAAETEQQECVPDPGNNVECVWVLTKGNFQDKRTKARLALNELDEFHRAALKMIKFEEDLINLSEEKRSSTGEKIHNKILAQIKSQNKFYIEKTETALTSLRNFISGTRKSIIIDNFNKELHVNVESTIEIVKSFNSRFKIALKRSNETSDNRILTAKNEGLFSTPRLLIEKVDYGDLKNSALDEKEPLICNATTAFKEACNYLKPDVAGGFKKTYYSCEIKSGNIQEETAHTHCGANAIDPAPNSQFKNKGYRIYYVCILNNGKLNRKKKKFYLKSILAGKEENQIKLECPLELSEGG